MAAAKLELRDLEILRALLRVRYLTSRQINAAFFSCPRVGRRRIQRLSEYDLIRQHAKGMPEVLRYTAWRLTRRGLDAVSHELPDEPVPDGVLDRISTGSLHHERHREALADLYLRLTIPERGEDSEQDLGRHRRWVSELRARASAVTWQPDGDVVLSASPLGTRVDVVPDAVVRSPAMRRRVFVELDRSTKDLGRIRDCLVRYGTVLRHLDFGADEASVLFVVRSAARKKNIQRLVGSVPLVVLREDEAVHWLRESLLAIPGAASVPRMETTVETSARRAYSWMRKLHDVLDANGMRAQLDPVLMQEGHERLVALYRSLKEAAGQRAHS
jgi:hypothetical protein